MPWRTQIILEFSVHDCVSECNFGFPELEMVVCCRFCSGEVLRKPACFPLCIAQAPKSLWFVTGRRNNSIEFSFSIVISQVMAVRHSARTHDVLCSLSSVQSRVYPVAFVELTSVRPRCFARNSGAHYAGACARLSNPLPLDGWAQQLF